MFEMWNCAAIDHRYYRQDGNFTGYRTLENVIYIQLYSPFTITGREKQKHKKIKQTTKE